MVLPSKDFLLTGTMVTWPGLRSTLTRPLIGSDTLVRPLVPKPPERPIPAVSSTGPPMMPQPIWYPASSDPPASLVLPAPETAPIKLPPTMYSRDDSAVVRGATGNRDSFFPATVTVQPSGVIKFPGSAEAIAPSGPGGTSLATGCAGAGAGAGFGSSGSANARGAVSARAQTVVSETRLFSMGDRASQVRLSGMGAVPTNDWVALCRNGKGTDNS
ncbi:Uncharacterised protein [Mycobacteroides abscessus subsp. abscessus]|nr:Uncharacterised protein [Mycobacteroides abscessus subsp. abscessus]